LAPKQTREITIPAKFTAATMPLGHSRARSIEEAILWHGGEAQSARHNFELLAGSERQRLLRWLESL
jgi:CxxC motif-containing protein (DUF1111 family)